MGNSQLIAAKHYLQVTDEHFEEAAHKQTRRGAAEADETGNHAKRPLRENEKPRSFRGFPLLATNCTVNQYPRQESNL